MRYHCIAAQYFVWSQAWRAQFPFADIRRRARAMQQAEFPHASSVLSYYPHGVMQNCELGICVVYITSVLLYV